MAQADQEIAEIMIYLAAGLLGFCIGFFASRLYDEWKAWR
jgi:hypothetical protein